MDPETGTSIRRELSIATGLALATVLLAACTAAPKAAFSGGGTSAEAKQAFERLYKGYTVTNIAPAGDAWMVDATVVPNEALRAQYGYLGASSSDITTAAVRIPITRNGTGAFSVTADGVKWTAADDLPALMRGEFRPTGRDYAPLFDEVAWDLASPGTLISGVRATTDTVAVSYTSAGGQHWGTSFAWTTSDDVEEQDADPEWIGETTYPLETWQRQVRLLRQVVDSFGLTKDVPADPTALDDERPWIDQANALGAVAQEFALRYTTSPAEPKNTKAPQQGRFVARIVAVDRAGRTITIDRIQTFIGDSAYTAARHDGADEPQDDYYQRNRVKERTVLPLGDSVAFTTFQDIRAWQPAVGGDYFAPITALTEDEFMVQYSETLMNYTGAWIVVSGGKVVAVIGCYAV